MIRILVLAALLAVTSCAPAFAACISIDEARAKAEAVGGTMILLTGDMIERAGAMFNSMPPESSADVKEAALADMPDGSGFLLVGPAGRFCAAPFMDPDLYAKVRRSILGQDA